MKSHVFAATIFALAGALGALLFAYVVTQGFAAEGCRFGTEDGLRWSAAGESLFGQGMLFGLPGAILVALLYRVMAGRLRDLSASLVAPKAFAWCLGLAFAASLLSSLHFILACGARTGALSAIAPLAMALRVLAPILALAGAAAALMGLIQGLADRPKAP